MRQHSEFEHSEQSTREIQEGIRLPQERSSWAEQRQGSSQKIYPIRHRRWLWTLVAIILILVLALLGGIACLNNATSSRAISLPQHTFQVTAVPQLVVKNGVGILTIHAGENNTVDVKATEHINTLNNPNDIQYTVKQNMSTIEVYIKKTDMSPLGKESVDLDITLPSLSNIQATIGAGNVDINGISGLMNIHAGAGNVDFKNGTVRENSSFLADAGSITFLGLLAPNGNYEFNANAGSIDVTLPTDSAFILDVSTNAGNVNNEFGSKTVGSNPTSQLHVHTNAGNVNIHQGY